MAITGTFNQAGVKRADVSAQNIMDQLRAGAAPAPSESFQQGLVLNPVFEEEGNADTYMQDLIDGNERKGTLMETMRPDQDYKPPEIKDNLKRDANKAVTDGNKVAKQASGGMEEIQKQKASFKTDFMQAKSEATQMLSEAAKDMDIDPKEAMDQMVAKRETSSLGMLAGAGASVVAGGGLATGAAAVHGVTQELSKKDKQLSPKEQEAILVDTLKRLQESRKPLDSREEASGAKVDTTVAQESPKQSDIAWENMEMADLAELLKADPEGNDQPEMEELMLAESELNDVKHNHDYVREHYADSISGDKMTASAESNGAMAKIMADARVVTVPTIDAGAVYLAGEGIKGVEVLASDTSFDSGAVNTVMDWNKLDEAATKQQLNADINRQFSI